MRLLLTALALLFSIQLFAQSAIGHSSVDDDYNLDFERIIPGLRLPEHWDLFNMPKGYKCEVTESVQHKGLQSVLVESTGNVTDSDFASVRNTIPAKYLGKTIEFNAWLKYEDVTGYAAIILRVDDANGQDIKFSSLKYKHMTGTKDWAQYSIKVDIPEGAQTIYIANVLDGKGKLWMDDAQVLIDGKDISQAKLNPNYNPHPPHYDNNPAASGSVKLKTAKIYYETYGSGQPILLLHGNSQNLSAFTFQIGALAKRFKVIAVDTRGQGHSTDETTSPLTYDLFADDMKQLLDSLHIKKTNILGCSDGGNTGLIMAVKYPQYVNKLAIMGANLFPTNQAVPDAVIEQVKTAIAKMSLKTDAKSKMQVRLFSMLLTEPHLSFDQIKTIKAPVLVMAGEHDIILDSHTRAIAAAIPKSKLMIFTGGTHEMPMENWRVFNLAVLNFLDR